ncbi:hypothetical protein JTF04_02700 [Mammaliicoccus vitulinus]|uniref:hypothetical protein n=1 Tax=Mammaliicoccus vitulinus TaxID=71237 RepID=UPI00194E4ACF|nr:hypothetical protein [Mammaliicoccus vitulinus]MBM6628578.1 hypothetical protein [Mammaliicoccus vitulinus]
MKLTLTLTMTLALITLYAYVKHSYKYASISDEVEPPIDFEETQSYKQNEAWFSGIR